MVVTRIDLSVINHCLQLMASVAFSSKIFFKNLSFCEPGHSLHSGGLQIIIDIDGSCRDQYQKHVN
jgi:hypothetical protein